MKNIIIALSILISSTYADKIDSLLVHPLFDKPYTCSEHYDGQFKYMGDALGADCVVQKLVEKDGRKWMRMYSDEGKRNLDWYGWEKDVLSPIDGKVVKIKKNKIVNKPGVMGKGPSAAVIIKRNDGIMVIVAHLRLIKVKENDQIKAGQVIGKVGNNGFSRHPHIHIGAWKAKQPLQLRFDQTKIKPIE